MSIKLYHLLESVMQEVGSKITIEQGQIIVELPDPKKENNNLTEAFDSPYPTAVLRNAEDERITSFTTDSEIEYEIEFIYSRLRDKWEVDFRSTSGGYGITGTGDQMRVFATVMEEIREFLQKRAPRQLQFSADKRHDSSQNRHSRANLYTALLKRYAPKDYDAKVEDKEEKTSYTLTRREKSTITEAFDKPYPTRVIGFDSDSERTYLTFSTDSGTQYEIRFSLWDDLDGKETWRVSFSNESAMDDEPHGITGTGDQMRVFSTVIAEIGKFLQERAPHQLQFFADKDPRAERNSRSSLYTALVKRYAPNDYTVSVEEGDDKTWYTLTKKSERTDR